MKATFENTDNALWPGLSVSTRMLVDTLRQAVVVAEDQDIAERRFFDGWVSESGRLATPSAAPSPAASPFERPASSEIVGLFPQPEPRP